MPPTPAPEDQPSAAARRTVGGGSAFEELASYSRAVRSGSLLVVSGTAAPVDPESGVRPQDTGLQTRTALEAALEGLRSLGGGVGDVVMTRLYLAPEADWHAAATVHGEVFRGVDPANTTLFVAALIPEGALVEVELVAHTLDDGSRS